MTNSSNSPRIVLDLIKTDYIEKRYIFNILLFIELYANIPMTQRTNDSVFSGIIRPLRPKKKKKEKKEKKEKKKKEK